MDLKHKRILLFDLETTGLDSYKNEIIEFGAILLEKQGKDFQEIKRVDLLIQNKEPIPEIITELTHITQEMIDENGVTKAQAYSEIMDLLEGDPLLIGYNVNFDLNFLHRFICLFEPDYQLKNDVLDVIALYRDFNGFPWKLKNAIAKYGVETKNTHRACDDILATYEVMLKMFEAHAYNGVLLTHYVNTLGYPSAYPVPENLRFSQILYLPQRGGFKDILMFKTDKKMR